MDTFWEYFSVLAPSVGLALIFWLVMRSLFRADTGERNARAELEEREAEEWARLRADRRSGDGADETSDGPAGEDRGPGPMTAS
jgi:hypothetical protein